MTTPDWQVPPALIKSTKPIYGFYVTYGQRFIFQHFAQLYAAKHFIDLMLSGDSYTRMDDFTILSERGVTVRMENPTGRKGPSMLDQVLNYEFTPQEQSFQFPDQFLQQYLPLPQSPFIAQKPPQPVEPDDDTQSTPKRAQRAPRTPKTAPKPKPEGLISVATIAGELKIDPKQARQALRKANITKPEYGWAFTPDQVPAITKAIKENLK